MRTAFIFAAILSLSLSGTPVFAQDEEATPFLDVEETTSAEADDEGKETEEAPEPEAPAPRTESGQNMFAKKLLMAEKRFAEEKKALEQKCADELLLAEDACGEAKGELQAQLAAAKKAAKTAAAAPAAGAAKGGANEMMAMAHLSVLKDMSANTDAKLQDTLLREFDSYLEYYGEFEFSDEAVLQQADIFGRQGKYADQIVSLLRLIHEFPKSKRVRKAKEEARAIAEQKLKRQRALLEALAEGPAGGDAVDRLARLLQSLVKLETADFFPALRGEFAQFIRRYPDHSWTERMMLLAGDNYSTVSDYASQILTYRKLANLYPDSALRKDAMRSIAEVYYKKLGDKNGAIAAYERLAEAYPDGAEADTSYTRISEIREELADNAGAVETLEIIVKARARKDPALTALLSIARIYNDRMSQYGEAIKTYERIADDFAGEAGLKALEKAAYTAGRSMKDYVLQVELLKRLAKDYKDEREGADALYEAAEITRKSIRNDEAALALYEQFAEEHSRHKYAKKARSRAQKIKKTLGK